MEKQRVAWIDVAKALLITCVVVTHLPAFAQQSGITSFNWMENLRPLFNPYFMPAFFVITGYCDAMRGSYGAVALKNFKLLMLPNFFVTIGIPIASYLISRQTDIGLYVGAVKEFFLTGGFWFLSSLFFSKLILLCICRLTERRLYIGLVCLGFLLVGVILHDIGIQNVWCFQNALIAVFFLGLGHLARELKPIEKCRVPIGKKKSISLFRLGAIVYLVTVACYVIGGIRLPAMSEELVVSMTTLPMFIILSISGTLFSFEAARSLSPNRVLQYIGRETIVIYLFHIYFLLKALSLLHNLFVQSSLQTLYLSVPVGILLIMAILVFCSVMNIVLNTKYLKFLLGKF